jgi:hypothetical protein
MSKHITVQINPNIKRINIWYSGLMNPRYKYKVKESKKQPDSYKLIGQPLWIFKEDCTVISETVDHVQPEPKGWCIKRTLDNAEVLNKWMNSIDENLAYCQDFGYVISDTSDILSIVMLSIPEGYTEVFTVEDFFSKVGYVAPIQRNSLYKHEGKDIYEGDVLYMVNIVNLKIEQLKSAHNLNFSELFKEGKDDWQDYSRCYLSPKEANQRLKEEVEKVSKERKFTIEEIKPYFTGYYKVCSFETYAIELVEKEFNVKYLEE